MLFRGGQDGRVGVPITQGRSVGRAEPAKGMVSLTSSSGVPWVRFHDLRHMWVSLLIQIGVHAKYIQEQAGHSSIQVTMDTYGPLFPSGEPGVREEIGGARR